MRVTSKATFLALILTRWPLSTVGDGMVTPGEIVVVPVSVPVVATVVGVTGVVPVSWVMVVSAVGTIVVVMVVTGGEGWLVQPATSTAIREIQNSRMTVRVFMQ